MIWRFEHLWDGNQWLAPAFIETDSEGFIISLTQKEDQSNPDKEIDHKIEGWAVPGFQNAHSHAFQWAMAGLTEGLGPHDDFDDFWSWRHKMYQLALQIDPPRMEIIARQLYATMLTKGYTWVAEFHYLHHNTNGKPYDKVTEMGEALLRAAEKTGMGITLIPIFYNQGGFNKEATKEQRRFLSKDINEYLKLQALTSQQCQGPRQRSGLGIHSLRSIKPENIVPLIREAPQDLPWHIHIAEQQKEVEESVGLFGQRPVQWLLDKAPIDERWHLVHATHINKEEIQALLEHKSHVCDLPGNRRQPWRWHFPTPFLLAKRRTLEYRIR